MQEKTILGLRTASFCFAPSKVFSRATFGGAVDPGPSPSCGHQGVNSLLPPAHASKWKRKPCNEKHLPCLTSTCLIPQLPHVPFIYIIKGLWKWCTIPFSKKTQKKHTEKVLRQLPSYPAPSTAIKTWPSVPLTGETSAAAPQSVLHEVSYPKYGSVYFLNTIHRNKQELQLFK